MSRDGAAFPWPAGSATGLGPMPGTDPAEALNVVLGEVPDLPFLPDLPERGPGADPIGRAGAILVDLPIEMTPRGWRLAARQGRDHRRAAGLLEADLDALVLAGAYEGTFKVQLTGPWTLAAALELSRSMEPALTDPGAVADIAASLAEGAAALAASIASRVPGARPLLQLDEPLLPAVLRGSVASASGLRRIRAVGPDVAEGALRHVITTAATPAWIRCDTPDNPFSLEIRSGVAAVGCHLSQLRRGAEEEIGEAIEAGLGLFVGAVPLAPRGPSAGAGGELGAGARAGAGGGPRAAGGNRAGGGNTAGGGNRAGGGNTAGGGPRAGGGNRAGGGSRTGGGAEGPDVARRAAADVAELWRRIGLPADGIGERVVITPAGGLAGVSPDRARRVLGQSRAAARLLPEMIEEVAG